MSASWSSSERFANLLLGASFSLLGVAHVMRADAAERQSPALWTVLALSVAVGILFVRRGEVRREPGWSILLRALPALVIPIGVDAVTPPLDQWPLSAELAFAAGGALTAAALLSLGRSFAILPAVRGIVTSGPYRVVRHPAYAGELVMVAACVLARPGWMTLAPLALGVPLVALRVDAEERLLRGEPDYEAYARRVRWRLLPLVW